MHEALLNSDTREKLNAIYRRLEADIAKAAPVCRMSGNCCNFDKMDHVLFSTTLELTNMVEQKGTDGIAPEGKLCPFWKERKCTVRDVRPLGCRVYFCDKSYQEKHSQDIYERYHKEIQALAREADVEYAYVPMVAGLRRYAREGRFYDPAQPFNFS